MTDKKQLLMDAAVRLFARDGLSVPTSAIAKEAGVSNGTLFNYFATKQELIDELYLSIKQAMGHDVLYAVDGVNDFKEISWLIWRLFIRWALSEPLKHKVLILLRNSQILSKHVVERTDAMFANVFLQGKKAIEDGAVVDIPFELLSEIYMADIEATISYLSRQEDMSEEKVDGVISFVFDIYWQGIVG